MWIWLLHVAAATLAANGLIDAWRNGTIFAASRASLQAWQDAIDPEAQSWMATRLELYLCSYCHSYWVGLILFLLVAGGDFLPCGAALQVPVYGFAVARLSWILNAVLPERLQYQRNPLQDLDRERTTEPTTSDAAGSGDAHD